jgi:hypothetical protein
MKITAGGAERHVGVLKLGNEKPEEALLKA